jgi:23S rRNA (cytosine1962-C5)-methyltransferase
MSAGKVGTGPAPDLSGAPVDLPRLLGASLALRQPWLDPPHTGAVRLFAGFYEGLPALAVDAYADTLVLHDYADPAAGDPSYVAEAADFFSAALPWLGAAVVKPRHAADPAERRGRLLWGASPAREVREDGIRYSVELLAGRDAGFFLDTRALRRWARERLAGKTVLNAFAYTGSLGVAAMAGGAARVVQLDASRAMLSIAKTSYTLNGLPIRKSDFVTGDFWGVTRRLRREGALFDCVFLDPPFFAATGTRRIDLQAQADRLINKVRPLVADGGYLVAIDNALFLPGRAYLDVLDRLSADGYLAVEELLPVPEDVTGFPGTVVSAPPVDPAPFNHPTKIAVLRVRRRAGQ